MSRRPVGGARGRESGRGIVVLAGEDRNDCQILATLIRAHRPDLDASTKLVRINDPVRLRKKRGADLTAAVRTLVGKARAKALQQRAPLRGLVIHEDFDGFATGPYEETRRSVAAELARGGAPCPAVFALAAWESEAWLLLFPDAFPLVHPGWHVPPSLRGKDTGRLESPKEALGRRLGAPAFRESDGPLVMQAASDRGLVAAPVGVNRSYDDFTDDLRTWD
ncbi:hypothetical protein ACL02R_19065 [Streptomyces sp. MS19]|uniref:hypothetical protein n=1 Tax=Streptomyces sp. MS19 TaxID=3385972 RepID=UPI0039A16308